MSPISRRDLGKGLAATVATGAVAAAASPHAAATPSLAFPAVDEPAGTYLVGTGIYDITGAVAETGAFGYAAGQTMTGLQQRLYAHAFILGRPGTTQRVVFVSIDLGACFQSIKIAASAALARRSQGLYTDANILISATHTHVGNSGHSHDRLYQIAGNDAAGFGYDRHNFSAVVDGIVNAVMKAHASLEPGHVRLQLGTLTGATRNRSAKAYANNADADRFDRDVNETVTQLVLTAADGTPRGLINWFAIHPTSFSLKWTQISGDNKGYAQYFFEQRRSSHPAQDRPFVAAFAQSDEGDVVSSHGNAFSAPGFQGDADEFANVEIDGRRQLDKALELFEQPGIPVSGPLDMRSRWVSFEDYTVGARYTGGRDEKLCTPARGWSFACGAENGPSNLAGIHEGMTRGSFDVIDKSPGLGDAVAGSLVRLAFESIGALAGADDPRQGAKPVLLPTGRWGWAPLQMQVQIMRIGCLAVIAVPGEATTMAGRRIRAEVLEGLKGTGVTHAVVAGLANQYTGYIATAEEYALQHYEGASTEFGPHELGAFLQEYRALADAMRTGAPVRGVDPVDGRHTGGTRPGVEHDATPPGQAFGDVLEQPQARCSAGDTVRAVFRGAHPKNDFRTMGTFLKVQRQDGGRWLDVLDDHDWDTSYIWAREGIDRSRCTVEWRIRRGTAPGTYRLVQLGNHKEPVTGRVLPYTGTSRPFTVA